MFRGSCKHVTRVELLSPEDLERLLLEHLRNNLLPECFLYTGKEGAQNWFSLDLSNNFLVTSSLTALFKRSLPELGLILGSGFELVSVGVGNGVKERLLLERVSGKFFHYYPVDVSSQMIDKSLEEAEPLQLSITAMVALIEDLPVIATYWNTPVLFCLLGNSFSNYDSDTLLKLIRENLRDHDLFLFDCSLLNPHTRGANLWELEKSCYTAETVRFNTWPLISRGVASDSIDFHIELTLSTSPAGPAYRIRKSITFSEAGTVVCGCGSVDFRQGEKIELGSTYRFSSEQVLKLLRLYDFEVIRTWANEDGSNLLVLARG